MQTTGSALRCPNCGHALATLDLDIPSAVRTTRAGDPESPILLRVGEAARLLGISRTGMYQVIATGRVPTVKIGRSLRVRRSGLEQLAEGR